MNKKYIMIGITCGLLLIAGLIYCITVYTGSTGVAFSSSLSKEKESAAEQEKQNDAVPSGADFEKVITQAPKQSEISTQIYVHICGAVEKPGVYETSSGARVCDLIELSGGLLTDAAGEYINQAEPVTDGQRIYIPTLDEVENLSALEVMEGSQETATESKESSGLININTASAEELMTLPGIGQAKADSIIGYRTTNGNFKSIDELMNITGIKEGVFNRISSYITVD